MLWFLFPVVEAGAQVEGTVSDEGGEPLPGASVVWSGTTVGTSTDGEGRFRLPACDGGRHIVVSFVGYANDTVEVASGVRHVDVVLWSGEMKEVLVQAGKLGITRLRGAENGFVINRTELLRAACCNLGESFTTNPSVDVSYADAATGVRQIKLLGLSGAYVQMLTENIPNYHGAAMPFALGYVPGPWMQSIQVSKGSASVKNGYESMTGQINIEFKKPQDEDMLNVNLYGDSKSRVEANLDGNIHLNDKLSTGLLLHYENNWGEHDENHDGFLDKPNVQQFNAMNRWGWFGERYIFQAGVKVLSERRRSGQTMHGMNGGESATVSGRELFRIGIDTDRYEAFAKNAFILDKEKNMNVALILSGSIHNQDAGYGYKRYDVTQKNGYASLLFETNFGKMHSLSAGLSLNHDDYVQDVRFEQRADGAWQRLTERETTPGAYAQYTFNSNDKLIVVGGLRADHSSLYGTFVTPRAHVKWMPAGWFTMRASAGKGYRTVHVLAENHYLMAGGRTLVINAPEQESAWNYGVSTSYTIPLGKNDLTLNAEYYYTTFDHQCIIDRDTDPSEVRITNLDGKSFSHTMQVDASYPVFKGMTLTLAYRLNIVKTTYGGVLLDKPLTNKYKGLVSASYKPGLGLWQFDATLQLNGGGRLPKPYRMADGGWSWNERFSAFQQLSAQVTRYFRHGSVYVGGENLTNFRQKDLIVDAGNPWGTRFDPTMVWGPVHGAMVYAGVRVELKR